MRQEGTRILHGKLASLVAWRRPCPVAMLLAGILFSGTCELDPPTVPPPAWELSGEGKVAVVDGPRGPMSRLQLSFVSITPPPAKSSYEVVITAGSDSTAGGQLPVRSGGAAPQAQLTWDEPHGQLIFRRYDGLHLNLVGEPEGPISQRSVVMWWVETTDALLQALFADSGSALALIERGDEIVELSVGITGALSADSAKAKGMRMAAEARTWRQAVERTHAASVALAYGQPEFASTIVEIEELRLAAGRRADTLMVLIDQLMRSQEDSPSFYNLVGFALYAEASALQHQSTSIYTLCQRFATLHVVIHSGRQSPRGLARLGEQANRKSAALRTEPNPSGKRLAARSRRYRCTVNG